LSEEGDFSLSLNCSTETLYGLVFSSLAHSLFLSLSGIMSFPSGEFGEHFLVASIWDISLVAFLDILLTSC
jgi:hypothetical protein